MAAYQKLNAMMDQEDVQERSGKNIEASTMINV